MCRTTILIYRNSSSQVRNQLGTPAGAKSFLRGAQFFELCPILLNYVQHIFIDGEKKFQGGFSPRAPLVTGLSLVRVIRICKSIGGKFTEPLIWLTRHFFSQETYWLFSNGLLHKRINLKCARLFVLVCQPASGVVIYYSRVPRLRLGFLNLGYMYA